MADYYCNEYVATLLKQRYADITYKIWREKEMADHEEAIKHDSEKPRWELLPYDALEEVVKVLTVGAKKYDDRNWEKGFVWSRLFGALMRHARAWFQGEDKDPETGLSHLAHMGCCILFLLTHEIRKIGEDDRPIKKGENN